MNKNMNEKNRKKNNKTEEAELKQKCVAIILAGGKGKRMGTDIPKQYIQVCEKPVLYYSLKAFQDSKIIDDIILVSGKDEIQYCKTNIVDKYAITKVRKIVEGGKERYNSVYEGLKAADDAKYVFIHDGARPMIDNTIINNAYNGVKEHKACVVAVPSKDTIKIADDLGYSAMTPDRNKMWVVQTPQVFEYQIIFDAYKKALVNDTSKITDDAMIAELYSDLKVKFVQGSYENIKITTPSDIIFFEAMLKNEINAKKR